MRTDGIVQRGSRTPRGPCAGPRPEIDERAKAGPPDPRRAKAVDNGGLRSGAMESALRPPLPAATQAAPANRAFPPFCGDPNPCLLHQSLRAKQHPFDPRKQTPGGRHQIGTSAGFKSESVAGFLLECVAGFVGGHCRGLERNMLIGERSGPVTRQEKDAYKSEMR